MAILLAGLCCSVAAAATAEFEVSAGVGRTDNLTRTAADEQDATLGSVGLGFSVLQETRRLDADLAGELQFMDYSGNTYSSELIGNAAARVSVGLIEDRLRWVVEDSFGQTRRDLFSVPTPDNREHVNFFSTGPDVRLRFAGTMSLVLGGRYSRVDYESGDTGSTRAGGWLSVERELPSQAVLGFNVAGEQVEPEDEGIVPTYDRTSASIRYALTGARSSVSLEVGGNQVKGGDLDDKGAMLRLELTRRVGRASEITLGAGQEFTDAGNSMRPGGGALPTPGAATDAALQTAQPYTSRHAELGWNATGRRTSLGLSAAWIDEDHPESEVLDRQRLALAVRGSRRLGPRAEVSIAAAYNSSDFQAAGVDNDDMTYTAGVSWRLGRRLRVEVSGEHFDYSSDMANSDAAETRYWLRLRFGEVLTRKSSP